MAPIPVLFGGIIATCTRMTNGNKWGRANVKKRFEISSSDKQIIPNNGVDHLGILKELKE